MDAQLRICFSISCIYLIMDNELMNSLLKDFQYVLLLVLCEDNHQMNVWIESVETDIAWSDELTESVAPNKESWTAYSGIYSYIETNDLVAPPKARRSREEEGRTSLKAAAFLPTAKRGERGQCTNHPTMPTPSPWWCSTQFVPYISSPRLPPLCLTLSISYVEFKCNFSSAKQRKKQCLSPKHSPSKSRMERLLRFHPSDMVPGLLVGRYYTITCCQVEFGLQWARTDGVQ